MNVKIALTKKLKSNPTTDDLEKLNEQLYIVNIALTRLWQEMGSYELAQDLLLSMTNKDRDDSEEILCSTSGDLDTDLALARLWRLMGKNELAERLLLNMSGKRPNASEEELCQPWGHHAVDLIRALLWKKIGKFKLAERLLLNMSNKTPINMRRYFARPAGIMKLIWPWCGTGSWWANISWLKDCCLT